MAKRAEEREAEELVRPHVESAERDPGERAEARPERLDVPDALQVPADLGAAPRRLVAVERVVRASLGDRRRGVLGREHAGEHRVVASLDARHVDEARRAADERAAGKDELRHALVAALGDRARAVADAPPALERVADRVVRLEALELLERARATGSCSSGARRTRPRRGSRRSDRGTSRRRSLQSSGQPKECCTRPGRCFAGSTSQSSFSPMPNFGGSRPSVERRSGGSAPWRASRARLPRRARIFRGAPCRADSSGPARPTSSRPCRRSRRR